MAGNAPISKLLYAALFFVLAFTSSAATVTAAWNAPADATIAGYYVYYGTNSGVYPNKLNAGTNTALTITGLAPGETYYFSTTSYNSSLTESPLAPEISFTVPGTLTVAPGGPDGDMRDPIPGGGLALL